MAGQPTFPTSQPPISGATAAIAAPDAAQMPTARPRFSPEKAALRRARLLGSNNAAPMPCAARATSRIGRLGASAHTKEVSAKMPVPMSSNRLRPKWSPSAPPRSNSADSGSR